MKIYSEFYVLSENQIPPAVDKLFEFIWDSDDFDSDGDYYDYFIEGKWSDLTLTKNFNEGSYNTKIVGIIYYEENPNEEPEYDSEFNYYIKAYRKGSYNYFDNIVIKEKCMIASFQIITKKLEDYKEFLKSVHFYLKAVKGWVVNIGMYDADEFYEEFLKD